LKKAKVFKKAVGGSGKKFSNKKPRMYDTMEWVEFRNRFLGANPKCYACGERSTVVDHYIPHKGDEKLFWSELNFIPLCKKHHDISTGLWDRHTPPKTESKLGWLNMLRLAFNVSIRVVVVSPFKESK
jgi:hypothetical protein